MLRHYTLNCYALRLFEISTQKQETSAALQSMGWNLRASLLGPTPLYVMYFPSKAEAKHLLWHHWLEAKSWMLKLDDVKQFIQSDEP